MCTRRDQLLSVRNAAQHDAAELESQSGESFFDRRDTDITRTLHYLRGEKMMVCGDKYTDASLSLRSHSTFDQKSLSVTFAMALLHESSGPQVSPE